MFGRFYEALPDGAWIVIRPLERGDARLVAEIFAGLSETSRSRRFLQTGMTLSSRELDRLVDVDHRDHEALVAVDVWTRAPVGVAHYFRTAPAGKVAEVAIAVVDAWQGRGVGRALVKRLARRAQDGAIERFDAWILSENQPALALLSELGPTERTVEGSTVALDIELDETESFLARPAPLAWWAVIAWWEPALIWADATKRALAPRAGGVVQPPGDGRTQ